MKIYKPTHDSGWYWEISWRDENDKLHFLAFETIEKAEEFIQLHSLGESGSLYGA